MEMKMTNAKAVEQLRRLKELEQLDLALPAVVSYRVVQAVRGLADALAPYVEMREKIVKKYAKSGNVVSREEDPTAFDACSAELEELDRLEIYVEIHKFPFSLIDGRDLPIKAMFALNFMLE